MSDAPETNGLAVIGPALTRKLLSKPSVNEQDSAPAGNPLATNVPELSDTAALIARGRELVRQAHQAADEASQQAEEAQVTSEQTDKLLDRANQLLERLPDDAT